MSDLTSEAVNQLVQQQLIQITDTTVRNALTALLVTPSRHMRKWFDGSSEEICWSVAEHIASNTLFVYSEPGFNPSVPWGIVNISDSWMGMDSNWFDSLERAFYDSFAASPLPIWRVIRKTGIGDQRVVATDLSLDDAMRLLNQLNVRQDLSPDTDSMLRIEPRTQKWW